MAWSEYGLRCGLVSASATYTSTRVTHSLCLSELFRVFLVLLYFFLSLFI